ncbi:putative Ankyrin repeat family protein [Tripterygium wilfordii]|uniref:Putative Ankyrin repeat family protein n=1 Tax=Tripterygium wilfordii TaxID=458696 RepID=A0A7J7CDQ1_TRIWF|nr:putative Ankyrin repeat family protein [Tripterygium wilfordii]
MDIRLFEAAQIGNVNILHQLLAQNPLILNSITLLYSENPLHVASTAGHVEFVKEILRLKPDLAKELNRDGFSPMHMAAANGHVEITQELLKADCENCRLEGRDARTPLHFAAMKGRTSIITEMVSACAECIEDVTVSKETALHLAINCSQFEVIRVLVGSIKELKKEQILNMKDEQGNTALHLATWKKQRRVIGLLLESGAGILEVNAVNQCGLTALDILQIFPSEAGDREIEDNLHYAGATRARDISLSPMPSFGPHNQAVVNSPSEPEMRQFESNNLVDYFKFKKDRDSPSEARSSMLIIAALVAAATFQAAVNPPGGVWQDTYVPNSPNQNLSSINKAHNAGESILGSSKVVGYAIFMFFNSLGFVLSLIMIDILTSKFPLRFELEVCMVAMYFSYNSALINVSPSDLRLSVIITTAILSSIPPVLVAKWMRLFAKWLKEVLMQNLFAPRR